MLVLYIHYNLLIITQVANQSARGIKEVSNVNMDVW